MNSKQEKAGTHAGGKRVLEETRRLSQLILDCANRGEPQKDFLGEVCRLILDHTRCDMINIVYRENERWYLCNSAAGPEGKSPNISIAMMGREICGGGLPGNIEALAQLRNRILCDPKIQLGSCFNSHGSFCVGNAGKPRTVHPGSEGDAEQIQIKIDGRFPSLAIIPSIIADEKIGLLELYSGKNDFFARQHIELLENVAQALGIALVNQRIQSALRERVKELTCLCKIATLSKELERPVDEILQDIVNLLPAAWQYPSIAHARIIIDNREIKSMNYLGGKDLLTADISVEGVSRGSLEIAYTELMPELDEGPFLVEERNLINAVAVQIALIIEQRQADENRLRLQDQLRHSDRLATIGQLVAGVAHELNEPLGSILGFSQLARKSGGLSEQTSLDIDKIINSALHAREVVRKLMLFSRQTLPRKERLNLNNLIREGLFFLESRCLSQGIEIKQNLAPDLPDITADPSQILQVLVNLSVNAVQAMPDGGTLTLTTGTANGRIIFIVEDTGTGMSREVMEKIFIPFFTTKDINEGTGLGLSVVHGIIGAHNGVIKVDSTIGKGTRFEVRLPIKSAESDEEGS